MKYLLIILLELLVVNLSHSCGQKPAVVKHKKPIIDSSFDRRSNVPNPNCEATIAYYRIELLKQQLKAEKQKNKDKLVKVFFAAAATITTVLIKR